MTAPRTPAELGRETQRLLDDLALVTDEPGRVTRTYLSPAHARSIDLVGGWMRAVGMETAVDAVATLRGLRRADDETGGLRRADEKTDIPPRRLLVGRSEEHTSELQSH